MHLLQKQGSTPNTQDYNKSSFVILRAFFSCNSPPHLLQLGLPVPTKSERVLKSTASITASWVASLWHAGLNTHAHCHCGMQGMWVSESLLPEVGGQLGPGWWSPLHPLCPTCLATLQTWPGQRGYVWTAPCRGWNDGSCTSWPEVPILCHLAGRGGGREQSAAMLEGWWWWDKDLCCLARFERRNSPVLGACHRSSSTWVFTSIRRVRLTPSF